MDKGPCVACLPCPRLGGAWQLSLLVWSGTGADGECDFDEEGAENS